MREMGPEFRMRSLHGRQLMSFSYPALVQFATYTILDKGTDVRLLSIRMIHNSGGVAKDISVAIWVDDNLVGVGFFNNLPANTWYYLYVSPVNNWMGVSVPYVCVDGGSAAQPLEGLGGHRVSVYVGTRDAGCTALLGYVRYESG